MKRFVQTHVKVRHAYVTTMADGTITWFIYEATDATASTMNELLTTAVRFSRAAAAYDAAAGDYKPLAREGLSNLTRGFLDKAEAIFVARQKVAQPPSSWAADCQCCVACVLEYVVDQDAQRDASGTALVPFVEEHYEISGALYEAMHALPGSERRYWRAVCTPDTMLVNLKIDAATVVAGYC